MVLDWLDLEVKANKRKYHALKILNQVIEAPQAICVSEKKSPMHHCKLLYYYIKATEYIENFNVNNLQSFVMLCSSKRKF